MSKFLMEVITNPMDVVIFQDIEEDIREYLKSSDFESFFKTENLNIFVSQTRIVIWADLFGDDLKDKLSELLPSILRGVESPNQMRWDTGSITFFSPIINILALLDDELIDVQIEDVRSKKVSLVNLCDEIEIDSVDDYFEKLDKYVGFNEVDRVNKIRNQVSKIAASLGKKFTANRDKLIKIAKIIENPQFLSANFDEKYYDLPEEFVFNIINKYDACIPLAFEDGKISNSYIIAYNKNKKSEKIKSMYENSLDYDLGLIEEVFEKDSALELKEYVPRLNWISKYDQLGNLYDKTTRVKMFVEKVADNLSLAKEMEENLYLAADLMKADLATRTVKKYPQLKGIVAKTMLEKEGYDNVIGEAILEQYLPGSMNRMPESSIGYILAIVDRYDDIVGLIISDEYNIRLVKNKIDEILNLIINSKLEISVATLTKIALYVYTEESIGAFDYNKVESILEDIFLQRYKNILRNLGVKAEFVTDEILSCDEYFGNLTEKLIEISETADEEEISLLKNIFRIRNLVMTSESMDYESSEEERRVGELVSDGVTNDIDGDFISFLKNNKEVLQDLFDFYDNGGYVTDYSKKLQTELKNRWF